MVKVKEAVDKLYEDGRTTILGEDELVAIIDNYMKEKEMGK